LARRFARTALLGQNVFSTRKEEAAVTSKLTKRRGNVYENKGPLLEKRLESGNVAENTDSYALKAVMLLKPKVVSTRRGISSGYRTWRSEASAQWYRK
jgi:hypothetical protein